MSKTIRKPSIWWALSPLAFELGGASLALAGGAVAARHMLVGSAMIGAGIVLWLSGFNRVGRPKGK